MRRWQSTPIPRAQLLSTLHSCTHFRDTETSYRFAVLIISFIPLAHLFSIFCLFYLLLILFFVFCNCKPVSFVKTLYYSSLNSNSVFPYCSLDVFHFLFIFPKFVFFLLRITHMNSTKLKETSWPFGKGRTY